MEFPDLGKHCNQSSCRQLDFLPVKCDACKKIFCSEHYKYDAHSCPLAFQKNVQVPVCPLCNSPVPGRPDELPDIRVSRHIDEECQSDRAVTQRKKVYSNKCSSKGCKQKEMIPLVCENCGQNYCLKHRLPPDHACTAPAGVKPMSKAALAALGRSTNSTVQPPKGRSTANGHAGRAAAGSYSQANIQGNLSENDALQIALQASMADAGGRPASAAAASNSTHALSQEQADFLLARAIEESEREARRTANSQSRSRNQSQRNCQVT